MSDENPFRSGDAMGAETLGANEEGDLPPVDLDVMPILERCWQLLTANVGLVIAAIAVQVVPNMAISGVQSALQMAMENGTPEVVVFLSAAYFGTLGFGMLVNVFVTLGITKVFSRISRGLPADVSMLFSQGPRFLQALVASLLSSVIIGASFLVIGVPGTAALAVAFGAEAFENPVAWLAVFVMMLVAVVPSAILGIGLQFWMYALVDQDLPAVDALRESWRLTNGYKMTIFLTNLAIGVVALVVTCLTCGIGYLVLLPLLLLSSAVIYHSLTHLQGRARNVPGVL